MHAFHITVLKQVCSQLKIGSAMCIRNFKVITVCKTPQLTHLAAFFIDLRTE